MAKASTPIKRASNSTTKNPPLCLTYITLTINSTVKNLTNSVHYNNPSVDQNNKFKLQWTVCWFFDGNRLRNIMWEHSTCVIFKFQFSPWTHPIGTVTTSNIRCSSIWILQEYDDQKRYVRSYTYKVRPN